MREMEDSGIEWIGEIPADWTLQRGKTIFAQRLTKGNQSEILLAATQKYGMLPQSEVEGVVQVKEDADLQQFRTVHKKDFVISLRSFQGGFEYSQYEGVCSPAYQVFYNTTPICHNYYRLLFKSDGFIQKMNSMTVGIREGKNIQYSDFANSLIPVPPIDQQQHIADYLDCKCSQIDAIIARQQEVIEKLKAYKLSVITEAVTKGLNPNVPMKDSGVEWIGEIPEDWEISKLKFMGHFVNGYAFPSSSFTTDGVRVMKIANIQPMEISWIDESYVDISEYDKLPMYRVEQGDLVFALTRPIINGGIKVAIFDGKEKVLLNQRNAMFKGLSRVLPRWMYYVMQNQMYVQKFALYIDGTGQQPNISTNEISQIEIPIPPIEVQQQVIMKLNEVIASIEKLASLKERVIKQLSDYKKSLIYEVVTGKKEV